MQIACVSLVLALVVTRATSQPDEDVTDNLKNLSTNNVNFRVTWEEDYIPRCKNPPATESGLVQDCQFGTFGAECECTGCAVASGTRRIKFACGDDNIFYPLSNYDLQVCAVGGCNVCPAFDDKRFNCTETEAGKELESRFCTSHLDDFVVRVVCTTERMWKIDKMWKNKNC